MTTTIAEYSGNTSNPWNAWVQENYPQYSDFIKFAVHTERLNADNRGLPFLLAASNFITENRLDYNKAIAAFLAYEVFRRELDEYRLAK